MNWTKTALAVASLVSLWTLCPDAWAHGGTLQLTSASAGPYVMSVWTQPEPPRAGRLHISVAVMQASTGQPVLDATVHLTAASLDHHGMRRDVLATRGQGSNRLLYDTTFALPAPGRWHFSIQVNGPMGAGSATFLLTAVASASLSWLLLTLAGGAVSLALVWLVWSRGR